MVKKDNKRKEFLSVRVSEEVKARLEEIAEDNDRSLSWVVNKILENYVKSKKAGKL